MTPSEAKRFCSANPLAEIIDELAADWDYYSNKAGPKPRRRIISEEKPE